MKTLTETDAKALAGKQVAIYEKLDMIYVKVHIQGSKVSVYSAKNREINSLDTLVNTVNRDIISFVDSNIQPFANDIFEAFGECRFGLFYLPVVKTKSIPYTSIETGSFILSDLWTSDKKLNDISKLKSILGERVLPVPKICDAVFPDNVDLTDIRKFVEDITGGKSYTGNGFDFVEGIIIDSGKDKYQVILNDVSPSIDAESKKIYRDMVLHNFVNTMTGNADGFAYLNDVIHSEIPPENKVCCLFLEFLNDTDMFNKMYIEPEDLVPPIVGYIGDIDWDRLPSTVKIVCKNEKYKNILRILLIAFLGDTGKDKFSGFDDATKSFLDNVKAKINTIVEKKS